MTSSVSERPPATDPGLQRALRSAGIFILLLVPLGLRLWPIEHGAPDNFVPDTHIVRSALGMAQDRTLVPEVGKYSTYPNLLPYMLLPIYSAQYAFGRFNGSWANANEFGDTLLEEPVRAQLVARWLVALLGALTPWIIFRTARAAGMVGGAWVAAWLVATGLLHVHFSLQERPWVPMVTFMALASWPAVLYVNGGKARHLIASGLAGALAFASHQGGLGALGIAGLAWFFGPLGFSGVDLARRVREGVICVAGFGVLALIVGHPYWLVHGSTPDASVAANADLAGDFSIGGQAIVVGISMDSFKRLALTFFGYDPALVVLALIGVIPALRNRALRPAVGFGLLWAAFFMTNPNDKVRYLLPLSVFGPLMAGVAVERIWRKPSAPVALVMLGLLVVPLVQALRFGWVMRQTDTRQLAAVALEAQRAELIAIDCYGPPLAKNQRTLERVAAWRELGARERRRLESFTQGERADEGFDVVPIEDLFDFDFRSGAAWVQAGREELGDQPTQILRDLGARYVVIVDRDPQDGLPPLLIQARADAERSLEPLEFAGEPIWVIHPGSDLDSACEAALPTELSFALTSIWRVARPGPRLELYELAQ